MKTSKSAKTPTLAKVLRYRLWQLSVYPSLFFKTLGPVRRFKLRKRAQAFHANPPAILPIQQDMIEKLKADGIAFTDVDTFFGAGTFAELKKTVDAMIAKGISQHEKKSFLREFIHLYTTQASKSDLDNPLVHFARQKKLVDTASGYLEMPAEFQMLLGNIAKPVGGAAPEGSQRWHRDPGVEITCKVFIYMNDVDKEAGPFTFLLGSQPGGKLGKLLPHPFLGKGSYYPPNEKFQKALEKYGAEANVKTCTGKAGTMIFCNTAGFHRGGFATGKERVLLTYLYI